MLRYAPWQESLPTAFAEGPDEDPLLYCIDCAPAGAEPVYDWRIGFAADGSRARCEECRRDLLDVQAHRGRKGTYGRLRLGDPR